MIKHITLLLVALSGSFIWTGSLSATEQQKSLLFIPYKHKLKYPDYKSDLQQLKSLDPSIGGYRSPDRLDLLEKEADTLQQKWLKKDMLLYYELTLEACSILSSTDLGDDNIREDKLCVKYAIRALKKAKEKNVVEMPLNTELELLYRISLGPRHYEDSEDWVRHRSEKMLLYAHAIKRFEKEIDEDFDFSMPPPRHPSPPEGVEFWIPGMGPEAIKDPKLRAKYEKRLVENKKKWEEYNRQYTLRSMRKKFQRIIGKNIVRAYLKPPYSTSGLSTLSLSKICVKFR